MQGGREEELLRFTTDTSGVVGPLEKIIPALDAVDQGVTKLADGFQILDADALGVGKIRDILYGVGQAVADDVLKVDALGQAFKDMMAGQDLTKVLGLDTLSAMSQTASARVAELRSQLAGLADENRLVTESWLAEENAMVGLGDNLASVSTAIMSMDQDERQLAKDLWGLVESEDAAAKATQDFSQGLRTPGEAALLASRDVLGLSDAATILITRLFTLGTEADVIRFALQESFKVGKFGADELASGLKQVDTLFAQLAPEATRSSEAVTQVGSAAKITATATGDLVAQIRLLTEAFNKTVFDTKAWQAAGYAAKDLSAGIMELISSADAFAAAQGVLKSAAEGDTVALEKVRVAALEAAQGLDEATLASSKSATKMMEDAAAANTAAAAQKGFLDSIAAGVNEFMALGMMIQMAIQAIDQFVALGAGIVDSFNVIQGMTASTDAQMQQWSSDVTTLDTKYGQLMTDAVPALDLITRAGFQAKDATTVLDNAMLLADSTGTKLADTTKAMTLAMDIYGLGASQARDVSLQFFNALSSSTLPLSSFVSLIDQSGLTAKNLGISLGDLITQIGFAGKVMGGSTLTIREFQGILDGLTAFTELSAAAMTKLAAGFDLAAFSALNSTGKFLDLAKASDGNLASFTGMIGGATNAQTALNNLGISTHQLAVNAANLGLAFDPVRYNALDAAGKLLYLATIADFSSTKFTALTKGGLEPATAAFLGLMGSMDAAGKHLADLNPHFDLAKFKLLDFAQQLHYVADFVGGTGTQAFATYVGGLKNVPLAIAIMNTELDKTPGHVQAASDAVAKHGGAYKAMEQQVSDSSTKYEADLQKQQDAADRVRQDVEHQTAGMSSAWQHFATSFVQLFGPMIAGTLNGFANVLNGLAADMPNTVAGFMMPWIGIPALFGSIFQQIGPIIGQGIYYGIDAAHTAVTGFVSWIGPVFMSAWQNVVQGVQWLTGQVIGWFEHMRQVVVGGSIVPEMGTKVVSEFQKMGTQSTTAAQQMSTDVTGKFQTLSDTAIGILQQMGGKLATEWGNMDQSTIDYWNNIADYVDKQAAKMDQAATDRIAHLSAGMKKNFQDASDVTQQTVGQMAANIPNQLANMDTQITSTFKNLGTQIGQDFSDIKTNADTTFQTMVDDINVKATTLRTKVMVAVDGLKTDMHADFLKIQTDATTQSDTMSTNVQTSYNKMQGLVSGIVTNLLAVLRSDWGIAATDAWTGGVNTGASFASGLSSQTGAVANAAASLAAAVSNNMPHSPAKEGPLMHADQFMPNFVHMLATGITNNLGELRAASLLAAQSIGSGLNMSSPTSGMGSSSLSSALAPTNALLRQLVSQASIGSPAMGPLGTVNQQFGNVNFNGVGMNNINQMYQQFNRMAGIAHEAAQRGSVSGMGW